MNERITIQLDSDVYDQLKALMVPPLADANAVIRALLEEQGHMSAAACAVQARTRHYDYAQELERARAGVYECGGNT